ncbi:hypothetical protein [Nostoc sp. CHAB 5715]|uniref:hypothetical protein n=1 Tax=Nostoc sp. CHAB 5715 TaxID=2780400 RepID=UPI001E598B2A|nr:hypothetical protein [Nostoc sp. CHAB 5715]MCC5622919.1 hypothetical protein [Nostoc sp. CHAB 5715]
MLKAKELQFLAGHDFYLKLTRMNPTKIVRAASLKEKILVVFNQVAVESLPDSEALASPPAS